MIKLLKWGTLEVCLHLLLLCRCCVQRAVLKYPGLVLYLPHPRVLLDGSALVCLHNGINCGKETFGTIPSRRDVLR